MGEISLERCNLFKQYASIESSSTPFPGIHHALAKERKVSNTKIGWGGGMLSRTKDIFSKARIRCIPAKKYFWERYSEPNLLKIFEDYIQII